MLELGLEAVEFVDTDVGGIDAKIQNQGKRNKGLLLPSLLVQLENPKLGTRLAKVTRPVSTY